MFWGCGVFHGFLFYAVLFLVGAVSIFTSFFRERRRLLLELERLLLAANQIKPQFDSLMQRMQGFEDKISDLDKRVAFLDFGSESVERRLSALRGELLERVEAVDGKFGFDPLATKESLVSLQRELLELVEALSVRVDLLEAANARLLAAKQLKRTSVVSAAPKGGVS